MKRLLIIFWAVAASAQIQGGLPTAMQSCNSNTDTNSAVADVCPNTVAFGHMIAGCVAWEDACSGGIASVVVSDNLSPGTSYTMSSVVSQTDPNFSSQCLRAQIFYGTTGASGIPTLTSTPNISTGGVPGTIQAGEFPGGLAADGSLSSTTSSTTLTSLTVSPTTTVNGDMGLACSNASKGAIGLTAISAPDFVAGSQNRGQIDQLLSASQFGASGSQSITHNTNGNRAWVMLGQAFKPTSQSIVTTQLPDAGNGTAYKAILEDIGGTGSPTWSVTSGTWPTGCSNASLNSSTGVISCTPTQTGSFLLSFSDGVATKTLGLKVGASLSTPTIASFTTGSVQHQWTLSSVQAGDTILLMGHMFDSGAFAGYIEPTSELSGLLGDITYTRICPYTGGGMSGLAIYTSVVTQSGSDTITFNKNGTGSPLNVLVADVRGGQPVIDCGVFTATNTFNTSVTMTTPNLTTLVANELLFAQGVVFGGSASLSFSNPFTLIASGAAGLVNTPSNWGQAMASTAGTYAVTDAGSSLDNTFGQDDYLNLIGIRPAIPFVQALFAGDKRIHRVH